MAKTKWQTGRLGAIVTRGQNKVNGGFINTQLISTITLPIASGGVVALD